MRGIYNWRQLRKRSNVSLRVSQDVKERERDELLCSILPRDDQTLVRAPLTVPNLPKSL
jgi:hypothetical protein